MHDIARRVRTRGPCQVFTVSLHNNGTRACLLARSASGCALALRCSDHSALMSSALGSGQSLSSVAAEQLRSPLLAFLPPRPRRGRKRVRAACLQCRCACAKPLFVTGYLPGAHASSCTRSLVVRVRVWWCAFAR